MLKEIIDKNLRKMRKGESSMEGIVPLDAWGHHRTYGSFCTEVWFLCSDDTGEMMSFSMDEPDTELGLVKGRYLVKWGERSGKIEVKEVYVPEKPKPEAMYAILSSANRFGWPC